MGHLNLMAARVVWLAACLVVLPASAQISISSKTPDKPLEKAKESAPALVIGQPADVKPSVSYTYAAYTGRMACDSKAFVTVTEDRKHPHHFDVALGKTHYKTVRVVTESGAIRLEDKANGIVWLQMANKSMLLDEKHGKRLATNCQNDAQLAADKALNASTAPTILDTPKSP